MPELPEVEVTRRRIAPLLSGRTVARVHTTKPSYFFLTSPATLKRRLQGRRFEAMSRHGKYLLASLDDGSRLLMHLGMTGQLFASGVENVRLLRKTARAALTPEGARGFRPDEHTHLTLAFTDAGPDVHFRDVRKFGKLRWLRPGETDPRLDKLGTDALLIEPGELERIGRRRRVFVKSLLLDQSVLAGVGNIYADEALFLSKVRPTRPAARVTADEWRRIADNVKRVLLRSIETGGSSISDYIQPDGSDGAYQDERKVYALEGEPCSICRTPIKRLVIGQRSSHYCPSCQR